MRLPCKASLRACFLPVFFLFFFFSAEVERDLIPLAQHAPQKFGDKLKTLVQLIGVFCRILRSSIKVCNLPGIVKRAKNCADSGNCHVLNVDV